MSDAPNDPFKDFVFEWRTDPNNNEAIWFLNPWTNGWEQLAMIQWCCHPPEKTQEVDRFFEALQSSWVDALKLTAANRQLKEQLEKLKCKNLVNAVGRICGECGHNKTEDGCPHCIVTRLTIKLDGEILETEGAMVYARDQGEWDRYHRLEGNKDGLLTAKAAIAREVKQ